MCRFDFSAAKISPTVKQLLIRRIFCEYKGTGPLKRKPLAKKPQQEFHEYVPPPRSPPPPPKPVNHYHEKPPFWILYGTKFQRKRDLILGAGAIALTSVMLALSTLYEDIAPALERLMPGLTSDSIDRVEMERVERRTNFSPTPGPNAGQELLSEDLRNLMKRQKYTPPPYRRDTTTQDILRE